MQDPKKAKLLIVKWSELRPWFNHVCDKIPRILPNQLRPPYKKDRGINRGVAPAMI